MFVLIDVLDGCRKLCSIIAVNGTGEIQDFIMRKVYSSFCQADNEWYRIVCSILLYQCTCTYAKKSPIQLFEQFPARIY